MSFKSSVITVAVIVLLVLMILISFLLKNSRGEKIYIDSCPDYWTTKGRDYPIGGCSSTVYGCCPDNATPKIDSNGTNCYTTCSKSKYGCCPDRITAKTDTYGTACPTKCYNTHKLGTVSPTCSSVPFEMDFSGNEYTGKSGLCNKRKWAKRCGLTWDGITDVTMSC